MTMLMAEQRRRLGLYALAALFAVFVYFFGLDSHNAPTNGDEAVYAHITRLTAASGHLLPLQSTLDHMRNTKPPLVFWQGIASTHGGEEWSLWNLRYPSVLYTVLTSILVFLLAAKLAERQGAGRYSAGIIALLVYLAFFSTYRFGRPYLINAPETFWLFLPFFILLYWQSRSFASRFFVPLALGFCVGIGLLYKSFALLAPVGLALAWWYLHQARYRWREFLTRESWKPVLIGVVALGMFALWFALDPDPAAVWREFIVGENVGKFDPHGGSYWVKLLWSDSSIWSMLLAYPLNAGLLAFPVAGLFFFSWRHRAQLSEAEKMLWLLLFVFLAVFSLPSQRSARYLLEAMPGLAVLCALGWQRIPRWLSLVSLAVTALMIFVFAHLAWQLQREANDELYPLVFWLLLVATTGLILWAMFSVQATRTLTPLAVLAFYLVFAAALRPFDGAPGNYDSAAQLAVQGKPVWVPCNFRASQEGHRFLLPGAEVHGYYGEPAPAPAELAKRFHSFAVQLPLGAKPDCAECKVIGKRLEIRSRQGEDEIEEMLKGNVSAHLFAQEWLIESAGTAADSKPEEGCR